MSKEKPGTTTGSQEEGFSLVMSLIFISLLSVMVVGFLTTMRMEVAMSGNHVQGNISNSMAQAGTDMALAKLRYATGTAGGLLFYASQPGRIIMATRSTATTSAWSALQVVDLHSGQGARGDTDDVSADLNQGTKYLISNTIDMMRVKWIYVLKDGTYTTSVPTYSAGNTNPVVGRFAYWVDDETARVNLNTAYTRDTTNPMSNVSQVDLKAFSSVTDTVLSALNTIRTNTASGNRYFNSLAESTLGSPVLGALVNTDKFNLTIFSESPDLNMFGEQRIVLTTQKRLAGNAPFLDILKTDNVDPGNWDNLDGTSASGVSASNKVNTVVNMLIQNILARSDWPGVPSSTTTRSFTAKYNASATASAAQIAVNIIDYVRCKESETSVVPPISGTCSGSTFTFLGRASTTQSVAILGVSRTPRVTERTYIIYPSATPTATNQARIKAIYEIHIPKYVGLYNFDPKTLWGSLYVGAFDASNNLVWAPVSTATASYVSSSVSFALSTTSISPSGVMNPGDYRTVEFIGPDEAKYTNTNTRSNVSYVNGSYGLINGAPNTGSTSNPDRYRLDYISGSPSIGATSTVTDSNVQSVEVNDPMVNHAYADWTYSTRTWGTSSSLISTLQTSTTVSGPQQDLLSNGKLTNVGLQIPAPAWTTTNSTGAVDSVAELGYIHTGVEVNVKGTPWRTLHMQPNGNSATLPDWLLMDMFAAPKWRWSSSSRGGVTPSGTFSAYTQPTTASTTTSVNQRVGGLINVNAKIYPDFTNSSTVVMTRTTPLMAAAKVFYLDPISVATSSTISVPTTTIANIQSQTSASSALWNSATTSTLICRGQIAEIKGVADGGEQDENKLRGVVDLLTTQGSTFRIYAIGQSIRQPNANLMQVTGERRTMTVIERAVNAGGTQVQFNVLYSGKLQ